MNNPLVSISCITYNHSKFIRECLDGFLMQKTTFEFEILIHDDASTDGTQDIIKTYQEQFPELIKPIFQTENQYSKGIRGINASYNYPRAQGKYIALCEGDDYWTDPLKLQKQVDFLENNEAYSICYHKVNILQNHKLISDDTDITEIRYKKIPDSLNLNIMDLIEQGNFIHTVSVMFRRSSLPQTPIEFKYSKVGDYFLYIMLTKNGHFIKKLDETMAVYRRGIGIYSSLNSMDMRFSMLQYRICLLSYLDNNQHKEILLKQTLQRLDEIRLRERQFSNVVLGVKGLIEKILKKIKHAV